MKIINQAKASLFYCLLAGVPLKTPKDWMQFAEEQMRGDQSKAQITMKIHNPNWERTLEITADVKGKDKSLVFIKSPAKEKGIGTLRLDKKMWNYFPKLKRKVAVSPSMLLSSWMGSNFTNDDLLKASSFVDDYHHVFSADKIIDGQSYKAIVHTSKTDSKVIWPKVIAYSSKKDCLPRFYYYFDKKDNLKRKLAFSQIQKFDGHLSPKIWVMTPQDKKEESTTLIYHDLKFKVDFRPQHFTLKTLTGK